MKKIRGLLAVRDFASISSLAVSCHIGPAENRNLFDRRIGRLFINGAGTGCVAVSLPSFDF